MADTQKLDEDLYSRQLYVLGHDAMRKMNQSNVLVHGSDGLAIEIVKNSILAGVKSVTVMDDKTLSLKDLGSNFYGEAGAIGESRVLAVQARLKELNRYVEVSCIHGVPGEADLQKYQVFVLVGAPLAEQLRFNELCRGHGVHFIAAGVAGLFGSVFVDFGPKFTILDANGEQPKDGIITSVQASESEGRVLVTCHEDNRHGLSTGDTVKFEEIEGLPGLNDREFKITEKSPYTFEIDWTGDGSHVMGTGQFFQVKKPVEASFLALKEALAAPEILPFDFGKMERGPLHHAFARGLSAFRTREGRFPGPASAADCDAVVEDCKQAHGGELGEADVTVLRRLARGSGAIINPLAALFGGIVGQEILKGCSGKFTPIHQFLYYDALESSPQNEFKSLAQFEPQKSRYDDMIAVYGGPVVEKLKKLNVFIIGSGAIGCEMLKNWAMMGISCGSGNVHVTDMDVIEKSNLNRQFLFRNTDIGQLKSETAAKAAKAMNKDLQIYAAANRVGKESEDVYNEKFWEGLDLAITALDNVDARIYVDEKCVEFKRPLVDSGTVGTKGSTQVVVPRLTESYASSADPPAVEFPICLLKNFPNKIEHTIQWARDDFEGVFKQIPEDLNKYLTEPDFFEKLEEDPVSEFHVVKNIQQALKKIPKGWKDCVTWAVSLYTDHFDHKIQQLLYNYPEDRLTEEGTKFWSGPKRAPTALAFDPSDPTSLGFVQAAASLYAETYNIPVGDDVEEIRRLAQEVVIPAFNANSKTKIASTDEEAKELAKMVDLDEVKVMKRDIPPVSELGGLKMTPIEFEKDDPANFHVRYVTACANLRARNYGIKEVTAHEAKRLAGRIIPAIATTTAMVTGLVCVEIMKIVQDKEVGDYRNGFCNLAVPLFTLSEPMEPKSAMAEMKTGPWRWNMWDTLDLSLGNCTLQEFLDHFEDELGLEVNMVTFGTALIYAFFTPAKKLKVRKKLKMTELILEVAKVQIADDVTRLKMDVSCANLETDEDVDLPTVVLKLK